MSVEKIFRELNIYPKYYLPLGKRNEELCNTYEFKTNEGEFILKLYRNPREMIKERDNYYVFTQSDIPVARFVSSGVIKERTPYMIIKKLKGVTAKDIRSIPDELYYNIGENIGRIHNINYPKNYTIEPIIYQIKIICVLNNLKKLLIQVKNEKHRKILDKSMNLIVDMMFNIQFKDLDFGMCHNRINLNNIIVDDNKVVGFINLEKAGIGNFERDVLSIFANENNKSFIDGYKTKRELSPVFFDRLSIYELLQCVIDCGWSYGTEDDYFQSIMIRLEELTR